MTIIQDLQIKIDFILNEKQLENLEKMLHNIKADSLSLGKSHEEINKKLKETANIYAKEIFSKRENLSLNRKLSDSQHKFNEAIKQTNKLIASSKDLTQDQLKQFQIKAPSAPRIPRQKKEVVVEEIKKVIQEKVQPKVEKKRRSLPDAKLRIQELENNLFSGFFNKSYGVTPTFLKNIENQKPKDNSFKLNLGSNLNKNINSANNSAMNLKSNLNSLNSIFLNTTKIKVPPSQIPIQNPVQNIPIAPKVPNFVLEKNSGIVKDLNLKINFDLNDQQLKALENTIHNIKSEALGLGHSHEAINKSIQKNANLYAIATLDAENKLNQLSNSDYEFAEALKQSNLGMYEDIKLKSIQAKEGSKVYQINTKIIESQKRYNDLKRQGANFTSFSDFLKKEALVEKQIQDQNNRNLLKKIVLYKDLSTQVASTGNKIAQSNQTINKSLTSANYRINNFSDNLRNFTSQLMFVNPATMSFAFALQGFGQMFKSLSVIAQNSTDIVKKSIASLQQIIFGLGVAAAGAAGSVAYISLSTARYAEDIKKNSEIIGMSADEYQRISYAAKISGINQQEMASSMSGLFQALKSNKDGTLSEVQERFINLGVALKKSNGEARNVSEILSDVADKFSKIDSPVKRATLAAELFGEGGRKMLPFLSEGSEKLRQLGIEAELTGNVLSDEQVSKLVILQNSYRRLTSMLHGLKLSIGMSLIPFMSNVIRRLSDWYEANGMIIRQNLSSFFTNVSDSLGRFAQLIRNTYNVITGFAEGLDKIGISLSFISKILLLFASWKLFGIIGNILLGKSTTGFFGFIASKFRWLYAVIAGFFTSIATFATTLIAAFGSGGLTGVLIFLGDVILGILGALFTVPVLVGLAVAGIFLLIQDFLTWMEGGDSLFKRMFGDWEPAKKKIDEFIENVKIFFKNMWQDIKNFFIEKFINPIKEHGLVGIVEAFGNLFIKICELIVKFTLYLEDKFVEICSSLFDIIAEYSPKLFSYICDKIKDLWNFLKPYLKTFFNWLIYSTLDGFKSVGDKIYNVFIKIVDDIKKIFLGLFDWLGSKLNKGWDAFNNFLGLSNPFGLSKGNSYMIKAISDENGKLKIIEEKEPSNKSLDNSLGFSSGIPRLNNNINNSNKNVNYNIQSPLNLNVSSNSDPQEIASIVQKNWTENWEYQMRIANDNIYRG
ncbi:hypothetical protein ACWNT8_15665 (plasmid) [Pigmentibacter ruber]